MRIRVWVDGWQMQCCGEPFQVGDTVEWTLRSCDRGKYPVDVLGPDVAESVTHAEEHHGGLPEDAPVTTGTVTGIHAVHSRYAPRSDESPRVLHPVPGSGQLTWVSSADGWEHVEGELQFVGYLVDLDVHGDKQS
ncbi:MAG TPA: DUF6578 domain-containing protein [Pseudonocardiaceae bacterium]